MQTIPKSRKRERCRRAKWLKTAELKSVQSVLLPQDQAIKVAVDLQRPNFKIFFVFAHSIAKTSI